MSHFQAGAAKVCITPPLGVDLAGYAARYEPAAGVHDDLFARALALQVGEEKAVLLIADLLGLSAEFIAGLRALIEVRTGLPGERVMVACTHTHSGPATIFLRGCGAMDESYLALLPRLLASAAEMALTRLRPARIGAGAGQVPFAHNRRGTGVVDHEVGVVKVTTDAGEPLALLMNYACHAVVMGGDNVQISADYPGAACATVEANLPGTVALFANGAWGDINPTGRGTFAEVARQGRQLAFEALKVAEGIDVREPERLRVRSEEARIPLAPPPPAAELRAILEQTEVDPSSIYEGQDPRLAVKLGEAHRGWAQAVLELIEGEACPLSQTLEIQTLTVDGLAFIAVPGETFVEIGLALKRESPAAQTIILGAGNGCIGYIPTDAAHAVGGYEVVDAIRYYGTLGPAVGAEGEIVEAARRALAA